MSERIRWFFVPPATLMIAGVICGIVETWQRLIARVSAESLNSPDVLVIRQLMGPCLVCFAVYYGFHRVRAFHPILHPRYRQWLELSPWTNRLPLPLGPVLVARQDALLIGAITLVVTWRYNESPLMPVIGFATAYAVTACLAMMDCRRFAHCIAIFLLLPLMILFWDWMIARVIVAAVVFLIAHLGLSRTLADFPWPHAEPKVRSTSLGFPFGRLGPVKLANPIPHGRGLAIALSIAWWAFAITSRFPELSSPQASGGIDGFCALVVIVLSLSRVGIYCGGKAPPISLWTRIWTGWFIIPRYDYVLLAPATAALFGIIAAPVGQALGLPAPLYIAVAMAIPIALLIELGPGLQHWRLTGAHRLLSTPPRTRGRRAIAGGHLSMSLGND